MMVVFIYSHPKPEMLEHDGLMTAVRKLRWQEVNIAIDPENFTVYDVAVGWGPFGGDVDAYMRKLNGPKALCVSAYMAPVHDDYGVVFYETAQAKQFLEEQGCKSKLMHAFGVDTDFWQSVGLSKMFNLITVGGWNNWHRYEKCLGKPGVNLAVGGIMRENLQQSMSLMMSLALDGWIVSDEVQPHILRRLYDVSSTAYLPADFGQERAVLEARSMGLKVEVEPDNPKLNGLLASPIWGVEYYANQLKKGVESCL